MKVKGIIKLIEQKQTFDSGFTKQVMVLTTEEQFPQDLPIEFIKDKTSLLDNLTKGMNVEISINLRGSEYKGKYYCSITGWRVEKLENSTVNENNNTENFEDDLPF